MTTFTRVRINPMRRVARHALASNERLHAIVQRAIDGDGHITSGGTAAKAGNTAVGGGTRTLWRLDPGSAAHALYIVGDDYVNAAVLQEQLGIEFADISSCSYDPFLDRLAVGQQWRFRLKANPTRTIGSRQHGVRGRRVAIVDQAEQIEWLNRQAAAAGFHIPINRLEAPEVIVRDSGAVSFMRQGQQVTLTSAIFDGILAVDDPAKLRSALTTGIGRGRGYGFGLMTLVPITEDTTGEQQ